MRVRKEVNPFLAASAVIGLIIIVVCLAADVAGIKAAVAGGLVGLLLSIYMLYFFRDPDRTPPGDPAVIVAGADGTIMRIVDVDEKEFLKTQAVRISIFLSLVDVHVNRSPIAGKVKYANYFPGKRYFTFQEKSSDFNQHSSILIEGARTKCLVNQIVGPVARRVVYWLVPDQDLKTGESIGMMKFGSRLDMYFPKNDIEVVTRVGDKVRAGETVVAKIKGA